MTKSHDDIKSRLLTIFRGEAQEHLQAITTNLMALEREGPPAEAHELLEATFREMHTLKGAARSVSLLDVEALCQALEGVLRKIVRGPLGLGRAVLDLLHDGVGGVAHLLGEGAAAANVRALIARLEQVTSETGVGGQGLGVGDRDPIQEEPSIGPQPPAPSPQSPTPALPVETIRVATAKLDTLLLQAEDLLAPMLAASERVREARALVEAASLCRKSVNRRPGVGGQGSARGIRASAPEEELQAVEAKARDLLDHLTRDKRTIAGTVGGLLEELRRLRLMPASTVLDLFPKMIWDLAREHGKEVEWAVEGADLMVDRKVLEAMKDPLMHLIRNAVDHGIEPQEARVQAGKPSWARVLVRVIALEGNQIEVTVEDDGRGVDPAQVRAAAIQSRLLSAEAAEALPDAAALELIFHSGLSTSPILTNVSGHGLGLAIVKERVEGLGGRIRFTSKLGAGTTVTMHLPATIATFHGLLVRAGGQPFLLPLESVERAIRVAPDEIESVEGREAIRWNGQALSLARLSDLLELESSEQPRVESHSPSAVRITPTPPLPSPLRGRAEEGERKADGGRRTASDPPELCVVVRSGDGRAGLLVEEILGDREVLVKELRPPLIRVRNVAGAGLLGTGQVVLILRPADLIAGLRASPRPSVLAPAPEEKAHAPTILVVDDSITTRMMEKHLLEAAGYQVRVAVDGLEAWTILKTEPVGLVVSDVDMPRLDGFELTARIRADQKLADLPVVLVTVLESREYKERGVAAGANAYIVKSSFDQSNLLEIIGRLI